MKKLFIIAVIMICSACVFGQYSTSKVHLSYPVRTVPLHYVPESQRTYHTSLNTSIHISDFVNYNEFNNRLTFQEWENVDDAKQAYLNVDIDAFDLIIEGMHELEVKEMVRELGEMHERFYYVPHIDYTIVLKWSFACEQHHQVFSNINPMTNRPDISSFQIDRQFRTPMECHKFMKENKELFIEKIVNTELLALVDQLQDLFSMCFRYRESYNQIKLNLFDNKKSEYYDKHHNGRQELKNIFASMPLQGPISNQIKQMDPWIKHFKQLEESLSSSDKKQKAAKADMCYNLAMIYLGLEIFDVSREYANKLINTYGDTAGKKIIKEIDEKEAQLKKHHLQSYHF